MVMLRRELRSQTDYTPETDFRLFRNVSVQDPRHNLDHYMVLGCLHSAHLREHTDYLGWSMWIPIRPPATPMREDGLFATLLKAIPKPKAREARNNAWILEATWRLINKIFSTHWDLAQDQAILWRLGHEINTSLKADQKRMMKEAGGLIEAPLGANPPPLQGSLAPYEGVLQGRGRPRAAACLG